MNKQLSVDINSDVGERPEALANGSEERLIQLITSANIACGGHAGDEETMRQTTILASRYSVSVGAHPSYPDRENFGRREMKLPRDQLTLYVFAQVKKLADICGELGLTLTHVKPHGALYNVAIRDENVALAISDAVRKVNGGLILVGFAGSPMLTVWKQAGFRVVGEAFLDRNYERDGGLRPRKYPDALITSPSEAAERALAFVESGTVRAVDGTELKIEAQTLCIHSDTPNAYSIAKAVKGALEKAGVQLKGLSNRP